MSFLWKESNYLGLLIDEKGIRTDEKVIKKWKRLSCTKELQSFLGLCGYYRRFINNYAQITNHRMDY